MPEITYSGLSRVPSDYECADGQLALSLNLVPENGSLQPVFPPSLIFTLPEGYKVAYIHKTTTFTHYIITKKDDTVNDYRQKYDDDGNPIYDDDGNPVMEEKTSPDIYYLDEKNIPESKDVTFNDLIELDGIDGTEIIAIEAIGNTLIVVTDTAMNYYLWKVEENGTQHYIYLGTHLPELDLSFGLQGVGIFETNRNNTVGEKRYYYDFEIELPDKIPYDERYGDLSDDNVTAVTERVLAYVNKFVANYGNNAGKFLFPFFVRYAYRLYDGSLTMHSAPILMVCTTGSQPLVCVVGWKTSDDETNITNVYCNLSGMQHSLDYIVRDYNNVMESLDNWKDIISSIDIFISSPIYTYDQGGECKRFIETPQDYCLCRPLQLEDHYIAADSNEEKVVIDTLSIQHYVRWDLIQTDIEMSFIYYNTREYPAACIELPQKTTETLKDELTSCCNFYLLKSIKIEDLATEEREIISVAEDYLQSLVNREQMTDDYDSHDTLVPSFAYNYNNRLNIANIKKKIFNGYYSESIFCYTNGYLFYGVGESITSFSEGEIIRVYFYIRQDNKIIVTQGGIGQLARLREESISIQNTGSGMFLYLYYPNTNAYKAVIVGGASNETWRREVSLSPHDFLNGAFYFGGWENPTIIPTQDPSTAVSTGDDATVLVANKIYNSEINNPFFFPVENIVTVGTGTILGIATAAQALSQGQFGSFPLYAFCDDGVWALSVSSEGVYSAVQPITRDVCINAKAITQLDSSVLFPTDRGIMEIAGSNCGCVTDILNGDNAFDLTLLPQYNKLLQLSNISTEVDVKEIREMLEDSVMLYDYINQRIYVCSDDCNIAYVISKKSNSWGMAAVDISSTVNSYPDAYAMTSDGQFVDFSHPDKESPQNCFLITRPMKLESPNGLKTVTAVLQRGYFRRGHLQSALFGSRNLLDWHIVNSSHSHEIRSIAGTPYKYFRIATLAQLEADESIFGATVNATTRFGNKER